MGKSQTGKTLFLDAGSEYNPLSINVIDLAIIESSKFNVTQICSFFGVPPIMVGQDQATTWGTGIESIILGFLRFTLNSDLERIENELTAKCCTNGNFVLFDREQLLAMDAKSAAEVLSTEIACGVTTVNEARRRKHRAVVEGGDVPLTNSTNIPLTRALEPKAPEPQPQKEVTSPTPPDEGATE